MILLCIASYGSQYGSAYGADSYGSYSSSGSSAANYSASAPNPYAQQSGYQSTGNDQYSGYSTQPQNIYCNYYFNVFLVLNELKLI